MTQLKKFTQFLVAGQIDQAKALCESANRSTLLEQPFDPGELCGTSFLYWALVFEQWEIVAILIRKNAVNAAIMNTVPFQSVLQASVAMLLVYRQEPGIALLSTNNFALASLIDTEHLNSANRFGSSDETLAFTLVRYPAGFEILLHLHKLGKRITAQTLNRVITRGEAKGGSLALILLTATEHSRRFFFNLMDAGYTLTAHCLNSLTANPEDSNRSVAAELCNLPIGRTLLLKLIANGLFINKAALNALWNSQSHGTISAAGALLNAVAGDITGLIILDKLNELGITIDANCLNAPDNDGQTPAFFLSKNKEYGHKILLSLAKSGVHINYEILNKRVRYTAGGTMAAALLYSYTASVAELFKMQDFALARKIDVRHLLQKLDSDVDAAAIGLGTVQFTQCVLAAARKQYCLLFTEIFKHDQSKDLSAPDAQEAQPRFTAHTMLHLRKIQALPVPADAEADKTACIKAGWQRCVARAL